MSNYTDTTQYQNDNFGFSQGYQHRNSQTFYPKDRSFQKRQDQNQKREDSQWYEEDQQYRYNQTYSNYAQNSPGYSDYSQQKLATNSKVYEYQAKNKQVNQDYGNFQQSGGVNKKLTYEQNDHNSSTYNDFKDNTRQQFNTPQKNSYSFENDDSHCLSSGSNDNLCDNLVMVNEQNGTTKFNRKKDQSSEDLYQHNSSNSSNKSNKSYQQFESQQNSCSPSSKSAAFYPSSPFQQFPMQQVFDQNSASSFDHNALKAQEWSPHKQNQNHKQQWQPSSQRQNQNHYNNKNSNGYFRYHGNPQIHQNVYKVKAKNSVSEFKPYEQPKPVETPKPVPVVVQTQSDSKPAVRRMKYEMCKNFREKGSCKYNDRCLFAHGDHELTRRGSSEQETEKSKDSSEKEAEDHSIAIVDEPKADEPTLDSTQLAISKTDLTLTQEVDKIESSLKSDSKKHSAESKDNIVEFELRSDIGDDHSEIQDTGENSTTLSSANDQNTPESVSAKANMIGTPNIYCFKKEEEFKDLLQNLDIENIEIDLFNKNLPENNVQILALDQKDKQIDIEIEKLLSDEGNSEIPQKSQDCHQGGDYELVQNLALNQFKRNSEIIIATNDLKEAKSSVTKNDNELAILKLGSQNASKVMQRRLQIFEDITTQDNI